MPRGPVQPDDDSSFDPRIRWAAENMENVAYIMQERKIRLEQTAIYAALKTGPKSNKELCTATGFHSSKIVNQIKQMKRKGIKIIAKRQKTGTIYTLIPAISGSTL